MKAEKRIALDMFPKDWKYFTLTFPVARYKNLSLEQIIDEMVSCDRAFYSIPRIIGRICRNIIQHRELKISLISNLSYRRNLQLNRKVYADFVSMMKGVSVKSEPCYIQSEYQVTTLS